MPERPIVIVGPAYPLRGGIAQFNESFCESLMAQGHSCELVSFYMQYPALLFPGKSQNAEGDPPTELTVHNWLSSVNPLSWFRAARRISRLKPRYVVIRFWLPFMGPALGTLAWLLRARGIVVIGLVDNAVPHESRAFDKVLSGWFFRHCDAFFTLSSYVAEDLARLAPGRPVQTHPHPVYDVFGAPMEKDEARRKLGLKSDGRYVLFFGFVRRYKGLDLLVEAFGDDRLKELNIQLLVAGEFYEAKQTYIEQVERLNLVDRVTFFDQYIPQDAVKQYFCAANIVAQTYRSATQSGVTQIAYHFGRPMLVTDVGGLAEIVPDGRVGYVTNKSPKAIADALLRFFTENKESEFSEAVKADKARFSWEHFAREFANFATTIKSANSK